MKKSYTLKSIDEGYPNVEFTFDFKTQLFSGEHAKLLQVLLDDLKKEGGMYIPPSGGIYLDKKNINRKELALFLSFHWRVDGVMVPLDTFNDPEGIEVIH